MSLDPSESAANLTVDCVSGIRPVIVQGRIHPQRYVGVTWQPPVLQLRSSACLPRVKFSAS